MFEIGNESNKRKNPYDYQNSVLDNIEDFYNYDDIGKLLWSCGLGKGLMSMFIIEKMQYALELQIKRFKMELEIKKQEQNFAVIYQR